MTRKEMLADCPEEFEDDLKNIIDSIESDVNDAICLLNDIKSVRDLCQVEECECKLEEIAKDLY